MTQVVVYPHLHIIRVMRGKLADIRAGFVWILRVVTKVVGIRLAGVFQEAAACGIQTRAPYTSGLLGVSYAKNRVGVLSEGSDGPDTVREIFVELFDDVFLRVVPGCGIGAVR